MRIMMLRYFLFGLLMSTSLIGVQTCRAMDTEELDKTRFSPATTLFVRKDFPAHTSTSFKKTIEAPDHFDPQHYQQNKLKKDLACVFETLLAGIMHTPYGRQKIQEMIISQDEENVVLRFYFPDKNTIKKYESHYKSHVDSNNGYIKDTEEALTGWKESQATAQSEDIANIKERIKENEEHLQYLRQISEQLPQLWEKTSSLHTTHVSVPKQSVVKPEGGSFPHDNPLWNNIIQQGFMKITKNRLLCPEEDTSEYVTSLTPDEDIQHTDSFARITMCYLPQIKRDETILHPSLMFFPLIDREIKQLTVFTKEETGLDLEKLISFGYQNIFDFAHAHGLTKDLLMKSNVIQFGAAGHAVALFFTKDKVYYYDNVNYDHPLQREVYEANGPIYEEAKYFKNKNLNEMDEAEFLQRIFQEIHFRSCQVAKIREQVYDPATEWPSPYIRFFTKPLTTEK